MAYILVKYNIHLPSTCKQYIYSGYKLSLTFETTMPREQDEAATMQVAV